MFSPLAHSAPPPLQQANVVGFLIDTSIPMNSNSQTPPKAAGNRRAGPQGTQLFSAEELRQFASESDSLPAGRASVHEPVLERLSANLGGKRSTVRAGRQTIGRSKENDIVIDDHTVSSLHAWIINQHGRCVIMNTLSTNGTFVNDKRIHEVLLKHGDHIRLGQVEFVFLTRESDAASSTHSRWIVVGSTLAGLAVLAWWLI